VFPLCLFVGLCKNYFIDIHKIRWKDGSWDTEDPLNFGGNPDHVTFGLGLRTCPVLLGVLSSICLIVTVLWKYGFTALGLILDWG